ncbi:MAG: protein kinase, partial [Actinomycetota bacterium]
MSKHTSSRSGLTKTGTFMGTVDYVAPEQIQGHDVDGRTDGYSLACVLFECLTAKVPFAKDSDVATLFGHIQDPPPRVTQARESLPSEIDEVMAQGMAKNPDDRPQTATALIDRAARALGAPSGPKEAPSVPAAPTVLAPPPP